MTEKRLNNGYTEYYFTDFEDYPDEKYIDRFGTTHPLNINAPFKCKAYWRGNTKEIRHYNEMDSLVFKEIFHLAPQSILEQPPIRAVNLLKERTILDANLTFNRAYAYEVIVQPLKLIQKEEIDYGSNGGIVQVNKITDYQYENTYSFLAAQSVTNSDNKVHRTEYDYAEQAGITCLVDKHIIGIPIEMRYYVDAIFQAGQKTIFQSFSPNLCLPFKEIELLKPATIGATPPEVERVVIADYTAQGYPLQVQQMNFPVTTYDWTGNLLDATHQGIFTKTFTYYPDSRLPKTITAVDGQTTNLAYDSNQRLISASSRNDNIQVSIDYSKAYRLGGNPTATDNQITTSTQYTDAPTQTTTQTFDGLGRPLRTLLNGVVKNEVIYDNLGRIQFQTYLPGNFTFLEYENSPLNRPIKETYPDGTFSTVDYSLEGNYYKTISTDENGNSTSSLSDILGRTDRLINALGDATIYEYGDDRTGNPTKIIPPMGDNANFTYHYTFDERKRLETKTIPQGGLVSYTYDDATDLPHTMTDANGNLVTYIYDEYGRQKAQLLGTDSIKTSTYDVGGGIQIGKMTQSKVWKLGTNFSYATDYVYDDFGRVMQSTAQNHIGGQDISDFTYNHADWALTSLRKHTGYENLDIGMGYEYDGFGRVTKTLMSLNGQAQLLSQTAWNNRDQLVRKILGNGLQKIDYQYNNRGWLTRINQPFNVTLPVPDCSGSSNSATQEELLSTLDADIYCGQAEESLDYILNLRLNSADINFDCYNPCTHTGEIHTNPDCTTAESNQQATSLALARDEMIGAYTSNELRQCADGSIETFHKPDVSLMNLPNTLYRLRLCNGTQVYIFEDELALITGTYYIIQELEIQSANQVFTIKDAQGIASYVALEELITRVVEGTEIYVNNFQPNQNPCSPQEFSCSDEERTFNINFFVEVYNDHIDLTADSLDYPTYLHRVKLCGFRDVYFLQEELENLPNAQILQTIKIESPDQTFMIGNTFNYFDGDDLFFLELHYNEDKAEINATARKNGDISFMDWQIKDNLPQSYGFQYDAINRIKAAKHSIGNYETYDGYSVSGINYDKNGNILGIVRNTSAPVKDDCYDVIDDLVYGYTGNQLTSVTDNAPSATKDMGFKQGSNNGFTYDANGNLIIDWNRYAVFDLYNHLNLPTSYVKFGEGNLAWDYDANGTKLQKRTYGNPSVSATNLPSSEGFAIIPPNAVRDYVNGVEYKDAQLEAIYHEEGRIIKNNGTFEWQFHFLDHLGNTRLLFADQDNDGSIDVETEILSIKNYYPFGMLWENGLSTSPKMRFGYNGKELDTDFGFNLHFYGTRLYDSALNRFTGLDPISDQFASLSTYNYASNSPIANIDLHGLQSVGFIQSFYSSRERISKEHGEAGAREFDRGFREGGKVTAEIGAGFTPAGVALDVKDFGQAAANGDGIGMFLSGIGFVPGVGDFIKAVGKRARKIFRELSFDDRLKFDAGERITPKGDGGSIADHVAGEDTKFISASEVESGTARFNSGNGLLEIDLDKLEETGSSIVDHNNVLQAVKRSKNKTRARDFKNAKSAKEVIIKGGIDPSAGRIIKDK